MKEATRIGIIVASVFILFQLITLFGVSWCAMTLVNYLFTGAWEPLACMLAGVAAFPFLLSVVIFWDFLDEESDTKP